MHNLLVLSNDEHTKNELGRHLEYAHFVNADKIIPYSQYPMADITTVIIDVQMLMDIPETENFIKEAVRQNKEIVAVFSDSLPVSKKSLLKYGIVSAFPLSALKHIAKYCEKHNGLISGTIGIVDANFFNIQGLSTIITKFGYNAVSIDDIECSPIDSSLDILCINCSQVSTHTIAKMYISGKLPKKNAIVLYKSDENDIYIHDIIKLNRLARVIYTLDEVYIMLIQLFFRQQFHAYIYSLYETSYMKDTATSYRGGLRQWYLEAGIDIFTMPDMLKPEIIDEYHKNIADMDILLARAAGFRWMT